MDASSSLNPLILEKPFFLAAINLQPHDPEQTFPYAFLLGGKLKRSTLSIFDVVPLDVLVMSKDYDAGTLWQAFTTWIDASSGITLDQGYRDAFTQASTFIGARPDALTGEMVPPKRTTFTSKAFVHPFAYHLHFLEQLVPSEQSVSRINLNHACDIFVGHQTQHLNCCLVHAINQYLGVPHFRNIKQFVTILWASNKRKTYKEHLLNFVARGASLLNNRRLFITDSGCVGCFSIVKDGLYDGQLPIDPTTRKHTTFYDILQSLPEDKYIMVIEYANASLMKPQQHASVLMRTKKSQWFLFDSYFKTPLVVLDGFGQTTKKGYSINGETFRARQVEFYRHVFTEREDLPEDVDAYIEYHDRCMAFGLGDSVDTSHLRFKQAVPRDGVDMYAQRYAQVRRREYQAQRQRQFLLQKAEREDIESMRTQRRHNKKQKVLLHII